jgi:predicted alpha/beta superfamily hydrolase
MGSVAQFLNGIVTELILPAVAKYPIGTNQVGLIGVSAGGLLACWAILQPMTSA